MIGSNHSAVPFPFLTLCEQTPSFVLFTTVLVLNNWQESAYKNIVYGFALDVHNCFTCWLLLTYKLKEPTNKVYIAEAERFNVLSGVLAVYIKKKATLKKDLYRLWSIFCCIEIQITYWLSKLYYLILSLITITNPTFWGSGIVFMRLGCERLLFYYFWVFLYFIINSSPTMYYCVP